MARLDDKEDADPIVLGVLNAVERNSRITQRSVASELGIAIGLVNAYVKRCARKGYIKVSQAPARRYSYYLTPKGFAAKARLTSQYLTDSLSFFRRARLQYGELLAKIRSNGGKAIILVGGGDLADIVSLIVAEHGVEVLAIQSDRGPIERVVSELGQADAYVITSIHRSSEVFLALHHALGEGKVFAPSLLQLPSSPPVFEERASPQR